MLMPCKIVSKEKISSRLFGRVWCENCNNNVVELPVGSTLWNRVPVDAICVLLCWKLSMPRQINEDVILKGV